MLHPLHLHWEFWKKKVKCGRLFELKKDHCYSGGMYYMLLQLHFAITAFFNLFHTAVVQPIVDRAQNLRVDLVWISCRHRGSGIFVFLGEIKKVQNCVKRELVVVVSVVVGFFVIGHLESGVVQNELNCCCLCCLCCRRLCLCCHCRRCRCLHCS